MDFVIFVVTKINSKRVNKLHGRSDDFFDLECLVVDHPFLLDLHALGKVKEFLSIAIGIGFVPNKHKKHVKVNHS